MSVLRRGCLYSEEAESLGYFSEYSEANCILDCTWKFAAETCDCVPWFLAKNLTGRNVCHREEGRCFEDIVSR